LVLAIDALLKIMLEISKAGQNLGLFASMIRGTCFSKKTASLSISLVDMGESQYPLFKDKKLVKVY